MTNENNTLTPAKIELLSNVSGAYTSPFWDGMREVTGTLDTVRKIKAVLVTLCSTGNELEAYSLILAVYDLIALETPLDVIGLEPYPDAIKRFIIEFLLDTHDLLIDYENEGYKTVTLYWGRPYRVTYCVDKSFKKEKSTTKG